MIGILGGNSKKYPVCSPFLQCTMHQLCKNQLRGTLTRGIGGIDIIVYVVKTWQSYNVHYCTLKNTTNHYTKLDTTPHYTTVTLVLNRIIIYYYTIIHVNFAHTALYGHPFIEYCSYEKKYFF